MGCEHRFPESRVPNTSVVKTEPQKHSKPIRKKMKQKLIFLFMLVTAGLAQAQMQTILGGGFPELRGKEIVLLGSDGFGEKELDKTQCDSAGHFMLSYPSTYVGAARLQIQGANPVIVLLNKENFSMEWKNLQDVNSLQFTGSPENEAFAHGITLNAAAEQKLAGLNYLLPQYEKQPKKHRWLEQEIAIQNRQFLDFMLQLPASSYAAYYLKTRKFLTDMVQALKKDNGQLPEYETGFKNLNFDDDKIWYSGLMSDLFAGMYQVTGSYKDSVKVRTSMNAATDAWMKSLSANSMKQQGVAEYCFKMLEQHYLTAGAEYIALAMLDQSGCKLDEKKADLFEQYRKMAVGNTAPDIVLENGTRLSTLPHAYKLVAFGASWCPNCQTDYPALVGLYKRIKDKQDIEVVYLSLDTDKKAYSDFYKEAPFITGCDIKGWAGKAVKDYHIFATPSYFLLNRELKIVAKIKNPEQLQFFLNAAGSTK